MRADEQLYGSPKTQVRVALNEGKLKRILSNAQWSFSKYIHTSFIQTTKASEALTAY